jgi:hypothetical protein
VTSPDEAGARARAAAERRRAAGEYPPRGEPGALDDTILAGPPSWDLLSEWAEIEVDPDLVYSTRRGGAPITGFKRLLMRLMRQYLVELESRQTRFNIAVLSTLRSLDERVERLERARGDDDGRPEGRPS